MSKYIIDTGDYLFTTDGVLVVGFDCDNKPATFYNSLDNLEELNSDYINENFGELQDEAYQRGHDDGYEAGCAIAFKPVSDAEYQRGLNDAWEAARRIVVDTDRGGFTLDALREIFGTQGFFCIMQDNTAHEAIDKIKAYEEKELHVGDEVIAPRGKAIVTALHNNFVDYLYSGGDCGCTEPENLKKTGRHFDIQSILEAMRTHD